MEALENYSSQFWSRVNDPNIKPEDLISNLCINTFSAIAFSSLVQYEKVDQKGGDGHSDDEDEEVPVLSIFLFPFKES
jgi:hypothetical protein